MNKPLPRRITAFVYGVAALFLGAVLAVAALTMWQTYEKAIADSESQAARFAGTSEAALNRSLLAVDMLLAGMGQFLRNASEDSIAADIAQPGTAQLLETVVRQSLLVRYVAFLNPDGTVVASSDRRGAKLTVQLPPGFLKEVLNRPGSLLSISAPSVSLATSQQVLYFARVLRLADGATIVAVAEVQVSMLTTIFTQGANIDGLEVTLEREGGSLLASMPPRDDLAGRKIEPALTEQAGDGQPRRMLSRLGGVPAIVVARPTLHRNLLIVASIPLDAALEDWRRERDFILGATLAFALMILVVSFFAHAQMWRQWRVRADLLRSKATLDQALESMADGFVLLDPDGRVVTWNRRFVDYFPWAEKLLAPQVPFQPIDEQNARHLQAHSEQELTLPNGQAIVAVKSPTPDGGLVCVYRNVTERRRHLADILEGKAQLQATLDALPDVLLEAGIDGRCYRFHSPRRPKPSIKVREPVGKLMSDLLPPKAAAEVMVALRDAFEFGFSSGRQFETKAPRGALWFEISVSRKLVGEGADARFIVILRDITESKLAAREIEHLAFYDSLTGLPNRQLLLHRLQAAVDSNARRARYGALLFLNLDDFKTLNDALGHATGDALLKEVAVRLQDNLSDGGTVARLGGDEFVVLLENLSEDPAVAAMQASATGEAILAGLSESFQLADHEYHSTCSIGAVVFSAVHQPLEDLLKQADIAMYYAKSAGGNALRFFEAAMQTAITARATLESELHAALAGNQFVLHYQSQVTSEGHIAGAEVLIRWHHPERGMVPPVGFIELAEETGLIVPIGMWVLETACAQLGRWNHDPKRRHLQLAVNVSARQFRNADFAERVRDVLRRTGADPTKLKLELTESLLQDKMAETVSKMQLLASMGIRFSMDDFGTGYSSLSYMTQLPLDQIKVDKFFVQSIGTDPKVELIIQAIIGMARNLELEIVAEGVETQQQFEFLQAHGKMLCQGYLFSKPVPLDQFEAQLDLEMAD
ncbi:diguanylate cyclase (GGDEF)-like protein/PAS domain S-box-containing protein [Variovorax paradoxus]|uniref:bifunctional diguanylate cyclase/phosphodiesterase n=1 Tax=Variovorax paradoxus TaxID=34073 RepID=UPI002794E486|nr:EAL domain-containing protein [Variovorax paradoxus]MDQ0572483.1 diguanylate cyclase (GGDEF)-like protein/PAS domain S-box-containing protein [Variovorax paradoxus]